MRDRTYLLFQRCYLVTLGLVLSLLGAGFVMMKSYILVSDIPQWQWVGLGLIWLFALFLACVGMFGKSHQVEFWTDPFGTGELFEFLVIGLAFPLFCVAWVFRKIVRLG